MVMVTAKKTWRLEMLTADAAVQTGVREINLPSRRLWFLMKYMDLCEASGDPEARWQDFQVEYLNNDALLAIDKKARQVGWSWTTAAGAVADGILEKRSISAFVSVNLEEAKEKVRYARHVLEALRSKARPRLLTANATELEFDNGSRLISHPCRPVRGNATGNII